ncbi:MAG: hypothetical protein QM783_19705 [Phycisphaerales bacterium]
MNTTFRVSLLALVMAAGNTLVLADDGKGQPTAPAKPETLKGPSVPDRQVPGVENGLGTMERGGDKKGPAREMQIPHREFMRMLDESLGTSAPENIRLSADQRKQIDKVSEEFTQKQRTYMQSHREEIEKLVQKYGPEVRQLAQRLGGERGLGGGGADSRKGPKDAKKPSGDSPAGDKPADPMQDKPAGLSDDARAEVLAKLKDLQANAPKAEDTRAAIWGLLKADQQAAVQTKVDAFKAEREKQMDERYKEREKKKLEERGNKKGPAGPGAPGAGAPGAGGGGGADGPAKALDPAKREQTLKQLPDDLKGQITKMRPEMQDRILARLADLPEGQREEAYAKLRERLKNAGDGERPGKNKK